MNLRRSMALGAALTLLGACDSMDQSTGPLLEPRPLFSHNQDALTCHTVTFDDVGLSHGDQITLLPTPLGFSLAVAVTPSGNHSAPRAVVYDTDNVGGPDFDLEWSGASARCPGCEGLGNIMVIEDSRGFGPEGDSDTGGRITITGFPASGIAFIESYSAVDQEDFEAAIELHVDGSLIGGSSGQGDGSVEQVLAASPAITEKAEFVIGGSGGVDNLTICVGEPAIGRMTGGGGQLTIDDVRVTRGFTIHCDITLSNNLEINWADNQWHISKPLTDATCLDDPNVDPAPPAAPFDTFIGRGTGRLNGVDGSLVVFTFVDSGEPGGKNDAAEISIWAPGADPAVDAPVLHVSGLLDHGNLQAHYDQPHGSNVNK